ncbi:MAG: hypothetical protein E6248_02370 [Clostridium sp.]|uniref:hypothetical protein n=1 Tax=Clostridium sp. TaxID=1506 RepID=UPI002908A68D|nr:hypothetical protein [Clostridium sp.]MDU5109263.1 hypothetical protein [Clostridium sp.]
MIKLIPILILMIGIILIVLNFKAIKKEDNSFEKILQREESREKDYDLDIIEIRKSFAETVLELQKEIEDLKISINTIKNSNKRDDIIYNEEKLNSNTSIEESKGKLEIENANLKNNLDIEIDDNFPEKSKDNEVDENSKLNRVKELLDNGLNDDEICEELSIGKGEVLLIRSLLKR